MSFLDKFTKKYRTNVMCFNCGQTSEITVPKGITIDAFIKSEACICYTCGCATLRRVMTTPIQASEIRKPIYASRQKTQPLIIQREKQRIQPLTDAQREKLKQMRNRYKQIPEVPKEEEYQYQQEVEYPINEPVQEEHLQQPEGNIEWPKPKRINLWTGKEEQ